MSPFVKVDLSAVRWMLRQVTYDSTPPDAVCQMEITAALVAGDLPSWSHREWATRWHCSPWKVRKHAEAVANQYPTTDQPRTNQYPTTLRQCFPHLSAPPVTKSNHGPTKDQPTNARIPYEKKSRVEGEKQQAAQAPARVSTPKVKSPKALEAEQGLECLRTLRGELHQGATGKRHTANWGKGAAGAVLARKIARLLDECRGRELDPLPCLEALARWVYGAPGADWLRSRSSPLVDALGGNALTRASRVDDALAWVAGGQVESRPTKSGGRTRPQDEPPGAWDACLTETTETERIVINLWSTNA